MALHSYTIYSDTPRTGSDEDTGISVAEVVVDGDEGGFVGQRISNQAPMNFVREQGEYDERGRAVSSDSMQFSSVKKAASGLGDWYSSIQRSATKSAPPQSSRMAPVTPSPTASNSRAVSQTEIAAPMPQTTSSISRPTRKDWFKSRPNMAGLERSNQSTLADMIRRDPPNPHRPHVPPVHYALGPENRGYDMLSRGGWQEGQPLGPLGQHDSKRSLGHLASTSTRSTPEKEEKIKFRSLPGAMPKLVVPKEGGIGVNLVSLTRPEECEESSEEEFEDGEDILMPGSSNIRFSSAPADDRNGEQEGSYIENHSSTSQKGPILTPIPVALKHNRQGIGMSKKRRLVTHSSLAMLHHEREGEVARRHHKSELRRIERDHRQGKYGTGKRAYARMAKEEEAKRQRLLDYMKS